MASLVTINNASVEFPTKQVFKGISLGISEGDRIGIVGRNGDGKSSLLKLIAGFIQPTEGRVLRSGSPTLGMLSQTDSLKDSAMIKDIVSPSSDIPWESDRKSRDIVSALLPDIDLSATVDTLSGGQRRRLDLARLLIGNWDILLLDEPTNHLDLAAITWLAMHLKHRWTSKQGALLVVTHDRWFLDEVCETMWEVYGGSVVPFEGGYSAYVLQRVERSRIEAVTAQKKANQMRKELAWLSRGAQARRSKPKFHLAKAQELIADVAPVRNPLELKHAAITRLGKQVLELENVGFAYPHKVILSSINWIIGPGDRIGILGANGVGKSTLLQLLHGTLAPTEGTIKVGKTVKLAMLSQNLSELKNVENDVVRVVCKRYRSSYIVDGKEMSAVALLERLGFTQSELNARCKDLSGGQRRRLQLLLTLLEEPNVLILDEPGNDLDTDMMAAMEDLLDTWAGTLIVVSHDRYLIERVTDNQFALVRNKIIHVPGGVDEYLKILPEISSPQTISSSNENTAKTQEESKENNTLTQQQRYAMRKKLNSLEGRIATQQNRVDTVRSEMDACDPSNFEALFKCQQKIDLENKKLKQLEDEWLELSLALQ